MISQFAKSLLFFETPRGRQVVLQMDRLLIWTLWLHIPPVLLVAWWFGKEQVWVAGVLALLAALVPTLMYLAWPADFWTRFATATAAMLFSDLLIHASGGMIEFHFHIFVYLAVLSCYRDFRIILWVTTIVALHHLILNFTRPESVFASGASFNVVLLHAVFVVLEAAYLIYDIFKRSDEYDFVVSTHRVLADLSGVATQVSHVTGALSESASNQASALQQVAATMAEIESQTRHNADNAGGANGLMTSVRNDISEIGDRMRDLVGAMGQLNQDSRNMAGIIKTIDSIAFQTNLLALNAAVEAARAGESGKGFAVVAEEVRNLAGSSAEAAKNIAGMIDSAVGRVQQGSALAEQTAAVLAKALQGISSIERSLAEIAAATEEQAKASGQVSQGLQEIEKLTQLNTLNANSGADAAAEMNRKTLELKGALEPFSTKRNGASSQMQLDMDSARRAPFVAAS